ncbi:MAG: DUF4900 domain-containing protein [Candidatus Omnitrophota bacterium]|nr:DUF4900 domain-containing protein [Candidatus Omnitrophota bacterium]
MRIRRIGRLRGEGGFILITVYLLLAVFLVHATALITQSFADLRGAQRFQSAQQSFYLAEAGVDQALRWLQTQAVPPAFTNERTILADGTTQAQAAANGGDPGALTAANGWRPLGEGFYRVSIDPDNNNPASFMDRYVLEGWGATWSRTAGGVDIATSLRRTRLIVQSESFSRYAYYTNAETSPSGGLIWFRTGDVITGPTHTNGQFSINGSPVFNGAASSVSSTLNLAPGANPAWNGGLQLGVSPPATPFPSAVPAPIIAAAGSPQGRRFNGNTTLQLVNDGTMRVTNAAAGLNNSVQPLPANGVVYVQGGNVTLQGTLQGQLTVATDRDVRVAGPVRYATDPTVPNSSSTDLLGIVAGNNVIVNQVAYQNMRIDASIMAMNTSFTVQNYNSGSARGTLTVIGGIIQKNRGAVGTLGGSGYLKDYRYDNRLMNTTPPFFPATGNYTTVVWEEK